MELLIRIFRRWIQFIGASTLLRFGLLTLTLVCVERGLIAVISQIHPQWLALTVMFGVFAGWQLGRSRLPGWASCLLGLLIGLVWLILSVGQMSVPLDRVLAALPPILKMYIFRLPPDFGPLLEAWTAWIQTFVALASRLQLWVQNFGSSTLIIDPDITSLVWGLALWMVSVWAAWWIQRKAVLGIGLLPATILLIYNIYYTNSVFGILWLVLTGGGWILLHALESYLKSRRRWQERRMGQTDIEPFLAGTVILLASGFMLVGGLLPSVSIQKISDSLQHLFQSEQDGAVAESLGLQQTPAVVPLPGSGAISLSTSHEIGPGPQLSQQVMMIVSVDGYVPPPPPEAYRFNNTQQPELRYYWRSQTFEVYNAHVWISKTARQQEMAANSSYHPEINAMPENSRLVRQSVERLQPMDGALFVTGELLQTDQPSTANWRASGDLIDARTENDTYLAESRIQYVSVEQLRRAGKDFPTSVHNYLGLPDQFPGRVRDLAIRLTIDQPTPYDQVMAIQNYLRQFPYSLKVPGAPSDREVADYFLFDLQKGYCDYFATTMIVMVRAVGIPSRLVTGFSSGTYDYNENHFVVRESNAHSWVEVYFPGIGWVEFEPTTNQLPFPRAGTSAYETHPAVGVPTPIPGTGPGWSSINWHALRLPALLVGAVLAGLLVLAILWQLLPVESWLLHLRPAENAIQTIQQRLYRLGRLWGVPSHPSRTPHEFADELAGKLERYGRIQRLAPISLSVQADVIWLTDLYTRLLFSTRIPTHEERRQAVHRWAHIRKCLYRLRNL